MVSINDVGSINAPSLHKIKTCSFRKIMDFQIKICDLVRPKVRFDTLRKLIFAFLRVIVELIKDDKLETSQHLTRRNW